MLALIVCAWILGAAAPSQAPPGNQPADKGAQANSAEAKGAPTPPTATPPPLQKIEQGPSTKSRSEGDGDKAERPNWAEIGAFWAGVAQAVVGAFGLAGLFFTVLYAKRAWLAAKSSAEADNAALKEIRKAARVARTDAAEQAARFQKDYTATHRPWIAIRDVRITGPLIVTGGMAHAQFQFTLENTGTTPALNVVVQPRCTLKPSATRAIDLLRKMAEESRKAKFPFGQCIFPDEVVEDHAVNLFNGDEMASVPVKDGTQKIMVFVFGYVAYRTVLDDDFRQTRFAFLIAPTDDGPTEMHVVDGKLECPRDELRVVRWPQGWEAD